MKMTKKPNFNILTESALTGELKICRIDKYTSSCEGGEEVFILVEKVSKSKFLHVADLTFQLIMLCQ